MARFSMEQAESLTGNGGSGSFFSLKNDKDTARVRFLYSSADDVQPMTIHELEMEGGRKRPLNCLREYGAPIDDCPFCAARKPVRVKYFIPLYNVDTNKTLIWERGKNFGSTLASLCSHYPNLVSRICEIERDGAAGDMQTKYHIYPTDAVDNNITLQDFELPEVLGTAVMDKSAEEMKYYLDRGVWPDEAGSATSVVRRSDAIEPVRRTPAGANRTEEVF